MPIENTRVGSSILSLATIFSMTYITSRSAISTIAYLFPLLVSCLLFRSTLKAPFSKENRIVLTIHDIYLLTLYI
jgi:hypothetical protein